MHTYDAFHRQGGPSATPIYDALYAEYVRSFRALPGDRSGEEHLGFVSFRHIQRGRGSYSTYSAGARSGRLGMHHVPSPLPPTPRRGL
ncbi:hypothetical protein NGM37_47820 [Streptomyces sp. TRM76130]|nr:hypothetical protein [Streptomyces sp. TRM76130]